MTLRLLDITDSTSIYIVYDLNTKKFYRLEVIIRCSFQRIEDYLSEIKNHIHMLLYTT